MRSSHWPGIVLAALLGATGCDESATPAPLPRPAPPRLSSTPPRDGTDAEPRGRPGVALSARRLELRAPSTSTIVSVEVRRGDAVHEGDVLVVLDSADAQADLRVVSADLRALQRERSAARLGAKVARRRQTRIKTLYTEGYAAADGVEDADLDADQAIAEVDQLDARIDALETKIARLRTLVEEHHLRSPMDGVVADRLVDDGALVDPSTAILRLVSEQADRVRLAVAPEDRSSWTPGRGVEVRSAGGAALAAATVALVAPEVDPATNALFVDATLEGSPKLPAGLAVWVHPRGDD